MTSRPLEFTIFHADSQTDGRTRLPVANRNCFANAPRSTDHNDGGHAMAQEATRRTLIAKARVKSKTVVDKVVNAEGGEAHTLAAKLRS